MSIEVSTVADDQVVAHDGASVIQLDDLPPTTLVDVCGVAVTTLPRPPGELLCRFATVNDVHFGETECGIIEGFDLGPIFSSPPGSTPYPEVMNAAAVAEIAALEPAAVVAKGDLTSRGTVAEYEQFLDFYRGAFGDRLHHIRGNHDGYAGETFADAPSSVDLEGVTLAILDTVDPGRTRGRVSREQLDWLDELAARADRPVLVFGHHHVWDPASNSRPDTYFGIHPDDSEALVATFARRLSLCGYFAGHTHRNRTRRFAITGEVPWVEVASVKDYPGSWAEYRVFEGGILQIHRRLSTPEALEWSELTRGMFGGIYPTYALGSIEDRCFPIWPRWS